MTSELTFDAVFIDGLSWLRIFTTVVLPTCVCVYTRIQSITKRILLFSSTLTLVI